MTGYNLNIRNVFRSPYVEVGSIVDRELGIFIQQGCPEKDRRLHERRGEEAFTRDNISEEAPKHFQRLVVHNVKRVLDGYFPCRTDSCMIPLVTVCQLPRDKKKGPYEVTADSRSIFHDLDTKMVEMGFWTYATGF